MTTHASYKTELAPDNPASHAAVVRPADFAAVEEFLHLLARAVRQFHTYPTTSPMCTEAIAACQKVFVTLEGRDRLVLRVTPTELIVDEAGVGAGTIVEQELVRRLHRAHVIALGIDRTTTARHLSRFCSNVLRCDELAGTKTTFAELMLDHGVDTIVPQLAHRPEVLDVPEPPAALYDFVKHEQRRRQTEFAAGGRVDYLYPTDKGWVRLDPGTRLDTVSLIDLAVLVNDPVEVATILLRLTDDDAIGDEERKTALERKFSDVTTLFASLDPRLARTMFEKLARAVLELEPARRTNLLRRTILPGLLDGRPDGAVLCDFPDLDLADSLCLLLELETAAPEVLTAALNRLDLPAGRRDAVMPLIDARLRRGSGDIPPEPSKEKEIDRLARRLVQIDAAAGKDFSEFTSFDLSIDEEAAAAIGAAREAIDATDLPCAQLGFLTNLVRLEPNPRVVDAFLHRALALFVELERAARQEDLAAWASRYRQLADELRHTRPDVADTISKALTAFYLPARAAALLDLHQAGGEARGTANALVAAFGGAVVPGLLALLNEQAQPSKAPAVISVLCEHARLLAPALVLQLGHAGPSTTRAIVKVLGFAGAGYEAAISEQLGHADDQTSREALRALARIGTTQAAALVARQLQSGRVKGCTAAEEALWHFPTARAAAQVRQLLGTRDFVVQHPEVAARLLVRAVHAGTQGLEDVLAELEPLRFHFWNPGLVRVALKARELRVR